MKRIARADRVHSGTEVTASLFGCPCHVPSPWCCLHQPKTREAVLARCPAWCPGLRTRRTAPTMLWLDGHHPHGTGAARGLCSRTRGTGDGKTSPSFCSDGGALLILSHKGGQEILAFWSVCQCPKDLRLWGEKAPISPNSSGKHGLARVRGRGDMGKHVAPATQNGSYLQ